ncbi:hypothetical protein ACQZV8_14595 [Magnetococcales bacterium HHB-1]
MRNLSHTMIKTMVMLWLLISPLHAEEKKSTPPEKRAQYATWAAVLSTQALLNNLPPDIKTNENWKIKAIENALRDFFFWNSHKIDKLDVRDELIHGQIENTVRWLLREKQYRYSKAQKEAEKAALLADSLATITLFHSSKEALRWQDKSLTFAPESPQFWLKKGYLHQNLNELIETEKAFQYYFKYHKNIPTNNHNSHVFAIVDILIDAYKQALRTFSKEKDFSQALKYGKKLLKFYQLRQESKAQGIVHLQMAHFLDQLNRPQDAIRHLKKAKRRFYQKQRYTQAGVALMQQALIQQKQAQWLQAEQSIRQAINIFTFKEGTPHLTKALHILADLRLFDFDLKEAEQLFDLALKQPPHPSLTLQQENLLRIKHIQRFSQEHHALLALSLAKKGLERKTEEGLSDEEKLKLLEAFIKIEGLPYATEKRRQLYQSALIYAKKLNKKNSLATLYSALATLLQKNNQWSESLKVRKKALEHHKEQNKEDQIAKDYAALADIFTQQKKLTQATHYRLKSIALFEKQALLFDAGVQAAKLAQLWQQRQNNQKALHWYQKSAPWLKTGRQKNYAMMLSHWGELLLSRQAFNAAEEKLSQSIKILRKSGYFQAMTKPVFLLGKLLWLRDEDNLETEKLLKAATLRGQLFSKTEIAIHAQYILAQLAEKQQKIALAKKRYHQALKLAIQLAQRKPEKTNLVNQLAKEEGRFHLQWGKQAYGEKRLKLALDLSRAMGDSGRLQKIIALQNQKMRLFQEQFSLPPVKKNSQKIHKNTLRLLSF